DTMIVDEIHALVPTKRGAHLALSLERLEKFCATPPQRIGLSATQRPLDEVARFLGGTEQASKGRQNGQDPRRRSVLDTRSHHGSIARPQRVEVEDLLKAGMLRALVATSSLELGIDMGAIDLVVQIEAPPSVASGLQRIGRGGHTANAISEGVIFPKFRGDL